MAAGDLLDRLSGQTAPKLPVHQFWAAFVEWSVGEITRADVIAAFNITANEEADLDYLKTRYDAQPNTTSKIIFQHYVHSLFCLAEDNLFGYENKVTMKTRIDGI